MGKAGAQIAVRRPAPPRPLIEDELTSQFAPAPDLASWLIETFVNPDGELSNEDHAHLIGASIACLWTNAPAMSKQRPIVGQAEIPTPRGNPWSRERELWQIRTWFGDVPDFLLTFDATYVARCSDATFCALVEHELYHCGQQLDQYGMPRFRRDGQPVYAIRGHDVEEFVGVVRRYGTGNAAGMTAQLVEAGRRPAMISDTQIDWACGSCAA